MTTTTEASMQQPSSFLSNPYPTLARIRAMSPVSIMKGDGGLPLWILTRYHDVRAALANPCFGQDVRRAQALANRRVEGVDLGSNVVHMLNSDPPDHTRLRSLIHRAFTPKRVAAMRPMIARIVDQLLDGLSGRDTVDLIKDYAFPLPIMIICELLGLPPKDRLTYRAWSTAILTHSEADSFGRAMQEMTAYFSDLMATRRAAPQENMLTDLLYARDEGQLTDQEVIAMLFLLLIGGHETTVNLIGTATLALMRNHDQLAWLRANLDAMPMAIDEFLRYESPVSMATLRFTTAPVTISGVEIPQDELVLLSLGGANRDPERFPDPDRLILDRHDAGHLAFGHGIHRCLGAFLGKLEGEIALTGLLTRFSGFKLAIPEDALPWRNTIMLRGLESLPVSVHD